MELAELNLLSGLWQILIIHERESGWPVHDLMALCRQLVHDEKLASYLEPNAVDKFRRFLLKQHYYFQYDMKQDSVSIAMDSPTAASERWLVKYLALHILQGCGEVGEDASAKCQLALPKCITSHLSIVYGGSLELLCKTHPLRFILDRNGAHLAQLTADCYEEVVAGLFEEEDLVYFFVDLLHKIGTTELKPCPVHTLTKYLPFMSSKDRKLLKESYSDNLSLFFLLNTENFVMTRVEKGSVYLKHRDPHYAAALFLRQQLNIQGKPDVSLCELVLRAKYASSSLTQYLFVAETAETEVRQIVLSHPALFRLSDTGEKLQLRNEIPTGARWDADAELLATAYFIDVLKDISATSPSRAICFNYIIHAASSAPPKCKGHLSSFYPGVEVIGLFHLHPGIFDLSSVNRVSLHTTEQPEMLATQPRSEQAIKKQAVEYAAKLLKYVCHLTPDLFLSCTEALPGEVRQYCWAPVRGRSQSIIKSGRAALAANSLRTGMTATSEASTQTINERTSEPLMCQPANEATEKEEGTERINQKGATIADNEIKRIDPAPALHEANAAEPCVLKAQPDVVSTNNASNGGVALSVAKSSANVQLNNANAQTDGVADKKVVNQIASTPLCRKSAPKPKGNKTRVFVNSKRGTASASNAMTPTSVHEIETQVIRSKKARRRVRRRVIKGAAVALQSKADDAHHNDSDVVVKRADAAPVFDAHVECVDKEQPVQTSLVNSPSGEVGSTAEATKTSA